jgi:hypothetical protein
MASVTVTEYIRPIFRGRITEEGFELQAFTGTGFICEPDIFVTCWHWVRDPCASGESYAAGYNQGGKWLGQLLLDLHQDRDNDLALGRIEHQLNLVPGTSRLKIASEGSSVELGENVTTYGYPLTQTQIDSTTGHKTIQLQPRCLKGYVTQLIIHERPNWGPTPSIELDMPAPAGLSGAPLISDKTTRIVGVIYGDYGVAAIDRFASIDPDTGERQPEIQLLTTFALAHSLDTLLGATGPATGGQPLGEYAHQSYTKADGAGS